MGDILGFEDNGRILCTIWFGTPTRTTEAPPEKRSVETGMVRYDKD